MTSLRKWLKDIFNLIDVSPVIVVHYRRILDDSPLPTADVFVLLGIPILFGILGFVSPATGNFLSLVIPTLAILIGFSVNAVILMAREPLKREEPESREEHAEKEKRKSALIHTRTNTLYALIVGLVTLLVAVSTSAVLRVGVGYLALQIVSYVLYFLLIHYFLTLLMISRRLYILVEKDTFGE